MWYDTIAKPSFTPPSWLFGPVWTLLYILMVVSVALVAKEGLQRPEVRIALVIFGLHLILNFLWSPLFFTWHLIGWSVVNIVVQWALIVAMLFAFQKVSPLAAYLQLPLFLWVSFAMVLNIHIWLLNR